MRHLYAIKKLIVYLNSNSLHKNGSYIEFINAKVQMECQKATVPTNFLPVVNYEGNFKLGCFKTKLRDEPHLCIISEDGSFLIDMNNHEFEIEASQGKSTFAESKEGIRLIFKDTDERVLKIRIRSMENSEVYFTK